MNPRRRAGLLVGVGVLIVVAVGFGFVAARGPNPNAVPTPLQVYDRTMSPFCTGETLESCPSNQAVELRATIARMIYAGDTNRQIDDFLLAHYPRTVLGSPTNPLVWLVPGAAVLIGLGLVVALMRRQVGAGEAPEDEPALPPMSPADQARVEADLRRFAEGTSE